MASRFIPVRRQELLGALDQGSDPAFARAAEVLHHVLRFEAETRGEALRRAYAGFDPDPLVPSAGGDLDGFMLAAEAILEEANFEPIERPELQAAFDEKSLFPLVSEVDLAEYEVLRIYRRGISRRIERIRGWRTLWRWKPRELILYDRLVVILRLRAEALAGKRTTRMEGMEPGKIYIKSFKNIPTADVEMVLPNARLRLRGIDRLLVGGPMVAGIGWTLFQSIGILAAIATGAFALSLDDPRVRAVGGVLLVLAGYLWKTHGKIKNTRLRYLRTLSSGLYFRNLANNGAVLEQVLRLASDEEEKEALLAFALLQGGAMTAKALDTAAEAWIRERTGRATDFDVADGLACLDGLGLAKRRASKWHAVGPEEALQILDARWDAAF